MTLLEQKIELILEKLSPHGLAITAANALAQLESVSELIEAENLPKNQMPKPPIIKPIKGKVNPKDIGQAYRKTAAEYLNYWITGINPNLTCIGTNLTWPTYQALILYCESKEQQPSTIV